MSDSQADILANLNPRQREAVTHLQGPCLVLAGPGSGKTRVITHRAAFLVAAQGVPADQILAVTFTNKAAEEMRLRLVTRLLATKEERLTEGEASEQTRQVTRLLATKEERLTEGEASEQTRQVTRLGVNVQGMWVCTFHAAALRLLREFAEEAGLRPDFVVWDEVAQQETLEEALRRLDLSRELWGVANLAHWMSLQKGALRDPTQPDFAEDPANPTRARVAEAYAQILHEAGALDFDDLIARVVQLLSENRPVRETVQARFRHVLVDELQDINRAQYQFLKLLAPPPNSHVLAVADDDQSIYGWRGSDFRFIEWFKRDYRARVVELDQSYRSTESILAAAREMIQRDARRSRRPLRAREPGGHPIHHYLFQTAQGEIIWLPRLIKRLVEREGYQYRDIAVLYRIHRLGEPIERALFEAGIPLQRIQKDPFFARPQAREVVRYLRLLRGFTNEDVAGALNFPRTLADELTMIQLRRLAADNQVSLLELARRADDFPEISPLTCARLRAFLHDLDEDLRPLVGEDISRIVEALFRVLERRRSPFSQDDQPLLDGFAAFMDFSEEGERLRRAVDAGRPIAIVAPATVDGACAAVVLEQTLANYLGQTAVLYLVDAQTSDDASARDSTFEVAQATDERADASEVSIDFGSLGSAAAVPVILGEGTAELAGLDPAVVEARGGVVAGQDRGSLRYSLSTLAWRLAQALLLAYERLDQGRFVVYDLETTGVDPRQDDIVEIAAQVVEGGVPMGPPFYSLVRPARRNFIPKEASEVHGITWADVEDAPAIETVLPAFLRYVEGATVVGHNILEFDNRFIDREMGRILQRGFRNPSVDTLELARRLLHEESHSLEHLISRLGLGKEQEHRAAQDVAQTHALFRRLMEENRRQVGLSALSELLPLVAGGILTSGVPVVDENAALVTAGARVTARHAASDLWARVAQVLGPDRALNVLEAEGRLGSLTPPDDDDAWSRLREDFTRAVADFEAYSTDRSLDAFLGYQALATSEDTYDPTADKVTLMTLHNAKGTEFKVVIITGVDHGLIPLWTVEGDVAAVAEERRVFYVGMTRAKERLYLFSARDRGDGFNRPPCQFALELPAEHVKRVEPGHQARHASLG